MRKLAIIFILSLLGTYARGQVWSGILDSSRAVDWTSAGVVGGIPSASWVQCGSTITPYGSSGTPQSATVINSALAGCAALHYVQLGPGTFYLNSGIIMKPNTVLRGAAGNATSIVFSGGYGCGGLGAQVCFVDSSGYYYGSAAVAPGGANSANWTGTNATNGTYTQGATSIRLTSVGSSAISNGQYIYLDQNNDNPATPSTGFTSGLLICDNTSATDGCSLESGSPGRCSVGAGTNPCGGGGVHRNLIQIVKVTAGCSSPCTGAGPFDVTITPGIYGKKWASGFNPGAWWSGNDMQNAGIENVNIDSTNVGTGTTYAIYFNNAFNCWVSGIRSLKANRAHVTLNPAAHITVQNSYFFGTQSTFATSYGVEGFINSDNLVANNIFQQVTAPIILGPSTGSVFIYNFALHDTFGTPTWMQQAFAWRHDAGAVYNLSEANTTNGYWEDVFHGTGGLNTAFRNYATGWEPGKTQETVPVQLFSYNRFENFIDNILGCKNTTAAFPGNCGNPYHTIYITHNGVGQAGSIYDTNAGNHETSTLVLPDPYVTTSLFLWGNYDVVNNAQRFNSGEVPSSLSDGYANAVPASHAMPSSFFYSSAPSYFSPSIDRWPPLGADLSPMVSTLPAQRCYNTISNGMDPAGTGGPYTFNPNTCYTATVPNPPAPPTGVTTTPH